jgi:hypothetical protein
MLASSLTGYCCCQGRLTKDIAKLEDERGQLAERLLALQQQVLRGQAKLDQFRAANDWNAEELEQWAIAQRQKEEDNLALEKYRCVRGGGGARLMMTPLLQGGMLDAAASLAPQQQQWGCC